MLHSKGKCRACATWGPELGQTIDWLVTNEPGSLLCPVRNFRLHIVIRFYRVTQVQVIVPTLCSSFGWIHERINEMSLRNSFVDNICKMSCS
jgi:hypothetical protein